MTVPGFLGIEVAKAQWDMALRPSGERWAVPNDASGVHDARGPAAGPPARPSLCWKPPAAWSVP